MTTKPRLYALLTKPGTLNGFWCGVETEDRPDVFYCLVNWEGEVQDPPDTPFNRKHIERTLERDGFTLQYVTEDDPAMGIVWAHIMKGALTP